MNYFEHGFPKPGEVFREYFFQYSAWHDRDYPFHIPSIDPNASDITGTTLRDEILIERPLYLNIPDLEGAIRAELIAEYWGGHIGSTLTGFRVNDSDYLPMPDVYNTPTDKECYYRCVFGSPATPIPLEMLKQGVNQFQFGAGPQIKYDFQAGFYWLYCFGVRIYYEPQRPHPTGRVLAPLSGQVLGDRSVLQAEVSPGEFPITQVDFIGHYQDFNWSGNGLWLDWHFQYRYGVLIRHMGSAYNFPWRATWNSVWVPNQEQSFPLITRVRDASGLITMTPIVENLTIRRDDRSIRLYPAENVPENFGSRLGRKKTCTINITDELSDVYAARLVLSTWCGGHQGHIYLNDQLVVPVLGKIHDISFDSLPVPLAFLREGKNTFTVVSETDEHAVEINWPGPALLVQYNRALTE